MITTKATLVEKYDSPSGLSSFVIFQLEETTQFLEGQFMMIEAERNGQTKKKPYSIATTSHQLDTTKRLGFYVKKASDDGLSARLTQQIKLGDSVTMQGPVGHYIDNKQTANYLFISTGSGISPNLSLFQHLVYEQQSFKSLVFLFGERTSDALIPYVEGVLNNHNQKDCTVIHHLSQEQKAGYRHGYVQGSLDEALAITSTSVQVFLCGAPAMVKELQGLLIERGVPKQAITIEKR